MFRILHQPYPLTEKSPRGVLLSGLVAGGFVALFLIVFQPFGTDDTVFRYKHLFLAGYGLIVAITIWSTMSLPARFAVPERWTVGKQLLMLLTGALFGITASYFYLLLLGGTPTWRTYGRFVANAASVAIFPLAGLTLVDYWLKLTRYQRGATAFNQRPAPASAPDPEPATEAANAPAAALDFALLDDQQRPVLALPADRIWCLRSDRNYVDLFHYSPDGQATKTTVRNTLGRVSAGLPAGFLHPHRSYYVRAAAVGDVTGNAQGYRLHHPDFPDVPVPVSRGKSAEILAVLR